MIMRTLSPTLLALSLASGGAQAQDHSHHAMPQPRPATQAHPQNHAATPAAEEPAQQKAPAKPVEIDHSAMGHAPSPPSSGHDGHAPPDAREQASGDSSRMDHSAMDHQDHAAMGHDIPPSTGVPVPELTAADRAAAFPDLEPHTTHDQLVVHFVQFNRLEAWDDEGGGQAWEGLAWIGNDWNKLWLRTEGEREGGHTESADLEVLYGRPVAPWWDLVAGIRHDFQPGGSQTFAAIGVMGLAPYKFEVEATAYLGESGQTAARVEAEYETLLTNRLVLQSLIEATAFGKDDDRRGIGSGLSTVEAGLRLRYEITRKFAPYVGVAWERAYGRTADLRREEGEGVEDARVVAGIRFWF